jgi:hypothetical protein
MGLPIGGRESRPATGTAATCPSRAPERDDGEALVEHRRHDLADRVVPFVRTRVPQATIPVGVGDVGVAHGRFRLLEVRMLHAQLVFGESPSEGMAIVEVEPTLRTEQSGRLGRPLTQSPVPPLRSMR